MEQYKRTAVICQNFIQFQNWANERNIKLYKSNFIDSEGEKYIPVLKEDQIRGVYFNEVEVCFDYLKLSNLYIKALTRVR